MDRFRIFSWLLALLTVTPAAVLAQGTPATTPEEKVFPAEFTDILKQEWIFLKEQSDSFLTATGTKGEFETTPEFDTRIAQRRVNFIATIDKHIKDQKFDTREFGVLLKARLLNYNADKQAYAVTCSLAVEAPYDIPSLVSFVPTNPYVTIKDTVVGGYRTNRLQLKFSPSLTWKVDRNTAVEARNAESSLYFKIRAKIDISQHDMKKQALLRIVPLELMLVNSDNGTVFWREALKKQ